MPQGQFKKSAHSSEKFLQKKDKAKQSNAMKKGARVIAPKKAKLVDSAKMKKDLEKAIRLGVEKQLVQAADVKTTQTGKGSVAKKQNAAKS